MQQQNNSVIISYCATFLNREMLTVYRQVTGLKNYENWVITRTRKNASDFPYDNIYLLKKHPLRFFHRFFYKVLQKEKIFPLAGYEISQIKAFANEKQAALIHVYLGTEAARLINYLQDETRPKVISFHGVDTSSALLQSALENLIEVVDLFLVRSKSLQDALINRGCPVEMIKMHQTGVPVNEKIHPKTLPHNVKARPLRLIQACRFVEKKGLDITIDAVSRLVSKGVPVQLDLAGDGPKMHALKTQVEHLGLANHVNFLGFLKNSVLLDKLQEYHIFLHPSRTTDSGDKEGIPNSLLESMAIGLPVIATNHSGIPEAVTHNESGLLIQSADAKLLASEIDRLISNPDLYSRISQGAHDSVLANYSTQRNATLLESIYQDCISRKSTPL